MKINKDLKYSNEKKDKHKSKNKTKLNTIKTKKWKTKNFN